jgi:elongator complex protein 3
MRNTRFRFDPAPYLRELGAIITEIQASDALDVASLDRILRRHPKDGRGLFARTEIVAAALHLERSGALGGAADSLAARLRTCPTRSQSGILPVTLLTRPHPCPGRCVFCPSDARMPKSYLSDEPGAQRAAAHRFDPYAQTRARLDAYRRMGHRCDKVELIVLGGTWSHYPRDYQVWFVARALEALDDFGAERPARADSPLEPDDFTSLPAAARGRYDRTVARHLRETRGGLRAAWEEAGWDELARAQRRNQSARVRCVGLSLETRPDALDESEVVRLRRLGATKVQLGIQSLDDAVLRANRRGHDVAATRDAVRRLRAAGMKIQAHWMPNLLGATPEGDLADFARLFADPGFRPDELKIYPTSLVESAELMDHHRAGDWRPYDEAELLRVVAGCMRGTPRWCRLTRVVRDIPSPDIVTGNRRTNFREVAEAYLRERGERLVEIRAREIRRLAFDPSRVRLRETGYATSVGRERFLEMVTPDDRLLAFLRLSLPAQASFVAELGTSAVIRELHVYGGVAGLGERAPGAAQHRGLGRALVAAARERAAAAGHATLAVISAMGTREYWRSLGFRDGELYQHVEST